MNIEDVYPSLIPAIGGIALVCGLIDRKSTPVGRRAALYYCLLYSIALFLLNQVNGFSMDADRRILATTILILCGYPLWRYLLRSEKSIPFMPFLCIIYGIYFALPVFSTADVYPTFKGLPNQEHVKVSWLILLGLLSMIITYYNVPRNIWSVALPHMRPVGWTDTKAKRTAITLGTLGLVASALNNSVAIPTTFGSIVVFLSQFSLLSIAILLYLQLQGKLIQTEVAFLWIFLLPIQALNDMSTGLLYPLFRDGFMMSMIFLFVRKRMPWGTIGVTVIFFIALLMVKHDFRTVARKQASDPFTRGQLYLDLVTRKFSLDDVGIQTGIEQIMSRLDNRAMFVYVLDRTPSSVPYWNGRTYYSLLWRPIPRIVFPDKPIEDLGQEFGHRYDILDEDDKTTSINLPQIIEMYANFGAIGVILGMSVMALIYHAVRYVYENDNVDDWGKITSVVVYTSLTSVDSNFTLVFGNLVYSIFLFYILGRVIFRKSSPAIVSFSR